MAKNNSELYTDIIIDSLVKGNAVVMVGSGFSRNAERIDGSGKSMPEWDELSKIFCKKLGKSLDDIKFTDSLTIAQEMEEMYGKAYLDDFIRKELDDESYRPGLVHRLLMQLRWKDVFTTNYDTLLERAYKSGFTRRYTEVIKCNDLLYSGHEPRIIKLHGSFPNETPFIISEEDFRRYPIDYAPFVNTVQQALLEGVMLMVGFSGNDPNFLKWIGWIRDNLGIKNAPRMYKIEHTNPNEIQRKMYAARKIDVIVLEDLDSCQGKNYGLALAEYLKILNDATENRSQNIIRWPGYISTTDDPEEFYTLLNEIHQNYPGWIYPKNNCLDRLSFITKRGLLLIAGMSAKDEKSPYEMDICVEVCWLLQLAGILISEKQLEQISKIIERHSAEVEYKASIIQIYKYMLCLYRIYGSPKWVSLYNSLKETVNNMGAWDENDAFLRYEFAMQCLYSLNWETLDMAVHDIPEDVQHGEWILKKAGLLAMLGNYKESLDIVTDAVYHAREILFSIKDRSSQAYNRYSSLESTLVALHNYILQAYKYAIGDGIPDLQEENDSVSVNKRDYFKPVYPSDFDWHEENSRYAQNFFDEFIPKPSNYVKPDFDLDSMLVVNMATENLGQRVYQSILFREMTGIPFRIACVTSKEGLQGSLRWLSYYGDLKYIINMLISIGASMEIEETLNRRCLIRFEQSTVDDACRRCIDLLRYTMNDSRQREHMTVFDRDIFDHAISVIPEVLSRLCVRCSGSIFEQLIDIILELYSFHTLDPAHFKGVNDTCMRVLLCIPKESLDRNAFKLWTIKPEMFADMHINQLSDPFKFFFERLESYYGSERIKKYEVSDFEREEIKRLFNLIKSKQYKTVALKRLSYIYKLYMFDKELISRYKEEIWAEDNLDTFGLPDLGGVSKVFVDDFPSNLKKDELYVRLKKHIKSQIEGIVSEDVVKDDWRLFDMLKVLVEKKAFLDDDASNMLSFFSKLAEHYMSFYTKSIGKREVVDNILKLDEVLGSILIQTGCVTDNQISDDEAVLHIVDLLDKEQLPHAFLLWCTGKGDRYLELRRSLFSENGDYADNSKITVISLMKNGICVEQDLIRLIIDAFCSSMTYEIESVIRMLINIIYYNQISQENSLQISGALPKYLQMTSILMSDDADTATIKLQTRRMISVLTKQLYDWFADKSVKRPEEVDNCKDIFTCGEEYAEVRAVWE